MKGVETEMSQADLEKASRLLEQAKKDVDSALELLALDDSDLDDLAAKMQGEDLSEKEKDELDLSEKEKDELFEKCLAEMEEILLSLTQALAKRVPIHIESEPAKLEERIPPKLIRIVDIVGPAGITRIEMAAPDGPTPWRRRRRRRP
jgi:hypothetical protein